MGLSEKIPGVLNWIEVRRVRRTALEIDGILFEEEEYEHCSVYASVVGMKDYRRMLERRRGQEGANGAADVGIHRQ